MCTIELQELNKDINLLINAINDGKHGIIHSQLFTLEQLINEVKTLEVQRNIKYHIKTVTTNYQFITDISELTVTILNHKLIYSLRIPLLEGEKCQPLHLIPIPMKQGKNFISYIPFPETIYLHTLSIGHELTRFFMPPRC